jgi:TnpA family transposase
MVYFGTTAIFNLMCCTPTHGQTEPVLGLAHMLGIKLMPRIRNWKELKFYRASKKARYQHLELLFNSEVDWQLISDHFEEMLKVAVSISQGKLLPSTILRRLGSNSHHNKLYLAFRELGRAVRTEFLLKYITDIELRSMILGVMNKSEDFNRFVQWIAFGGQGVIAENNRDEQRKLIKYNHLVANCLIFHNVQSMTKALHSLIKEGLDVKDETLKRLSPYLTGHINRFGEYRLDMSRKPAPLDYHLPIIGR